MAATTTTCGNFSTKKRIPVSLVSGFLHPSAGPNVVRQEAAGSKNQGGAYVPPFFGGMYPPSRKGRRHAKLRHVCATPDFHRVSRAEGPKGQTYKTATCSLFAVADHDSLRNAVVHRAAVGMNEL